MSERRKFEDKTSKSGKSSFGLGTLMAPTNSKSQFPAFVPPVLKEVGKLAAGVASVSTSNTASGSATGNPRNKVALQPGHSLMDWIRLGTSGKDLTGLGPRAGSLSVTKQELARHNRREDAWLAVRGKVYNITHYFPFHPGGEEELMRGAGIDATDLFDQVHPWVNYEQILAKCLVGRLVAFDPNVDIQALFAGVEKPDSTKKAANQEKQSSANSLGVSSQNNSTSSERIEQQENPLPRFDWIQKLDYITIIFYTKSFSNPSVEICPPAEDNTVLVSIVYENTIFKNEVTFNNKVRWPCDVTVTVETGKVELVFRKLVSGIWENYGVLKQQRKPLNKISAGQIKSNYVLKSKYPVNHNTWLLKFEKDDGKKFVVPLGHHVRIIGENDISRSYTPVPECLFDKFVPHCNKKNSVCFMIKKYPNGTVSRYIIDKNVGDKVEVTRPLGKFDLKMVEKRESFLMLAAGTGITPMLGLILFFLERRIQKCQFVRLLSFNRSEKDILFRPELEELVGVDERFKVDHILSEADNSWTGLRGHVNEKLIDQTLKEHLDNTCYTLQDIFVFVCGPPKFNQKAIEELKKANIERDQIHVFDG